jgi:hypothetical protein
MRNVLVATVALTTLNACSGTIFNYTPAKTQPTLADVTSTYQAYSVSNVSAAAFDDWATNVAMTPQFFEIPLIGAAIAGVAELAYGHTHTGPAISLALAGCGLAVIDNYYNPRTRVGVYTDAASAMRCITRTAAPLISDEQSQTITTASGGKVTVVTDTPYTYNDGTGGIFTIAQAEAAATDAQTQTTLQNLVFLETNKARLLADAMEQVDSRAVARGLSASAAPDVSTITSNLKSSLQTTQTQQANAAAAGPAVSAAVANAAPPHAALPPGSPPPPAKQNPLDDPRVKALLTIQSDITACVAKAG